MARDEVTAWRASDKRAFIGQQGQRLREVLTRKDVPGIGFSILDVSMPPGVHILPHRHNHSAIAIRLCRGQAATVWGPNLEFAVLHGRGDVVSVPAGVPHLAVNLSMVITECSDAVGGHVYGVEVREDPHGDCDTEQLPELAEATKRAVVALRQRVHDEGGLTALVERGSWPLYWTLT